MEGEPGVSSRPDSWTEDDSRTFREIAERLGAAISAELLVEPMRSLVGKRIELAYAA